MLRLVITSAASNMYVNLFPSLTPRRCGRKQLSFGVENSGIEDSPISGITLKTYVCSGSQDLVQLKNIRISWSVLAKNG